MDERSTRYNGGSCLGIVLVDLQRNYNCIFAIGNALDLSAFACRSVNEFVLENIITAVALLSNCKWLVGCMDETING